VRDAADLYDPARVNLETLQSLDRLGERSSRNLLAALEASKQRPLERLLFGLGIRHVGATVARLLARRYGSLERLRAASEEELAEIPGIGPEIARSVHTFFRQEETAAVLEKLARFGVLPEPREPEAVAETPAPFAGKTFVFTGALQQMSRSEAEERVRKLGGTASSSVSRKTAFVVAGEKAGSKLRKARELDVPVLTEAEFLEMAAAAESG